MVLAVEVGMCVNSVETTTRITRSKQRSALSAKKETEKRKMKALY